jgi:hypothetical protein
MIFLAMFLAQAATTPAPLTGVWSVGEVRNCESGEAWVFTADGYYVELQLPSSPIGAVGAFTDKGNAIDYTHAHMPFASAETAQVKRSYTITNRTADRIDALNYKGEKRAFHKCPISAVKKSEDGR